MNKKQVNYKPELRWFMRQMELKLQKHSERGKSWKRDMPCDLFNTLEREVEELRAALHPFADSVIGDTPQDFDNVIQECADVANMAMMVADRMLITKMAVESVRNAPKESAAPTPGVALQGEGRP